MQRRRVSVAWTLFGASRREGVPNYGYMRDKDHGRITGVILMGNECHEYFFSTFGMHNCVFPPFVCVFVGLFVCKVISLHRIFAFFI